MTFTKRTYLAYKKVIIFGTGTLAALLAIISATNLFAISTSGDITCGTECISYFNITASNYSLCFGSTFKGVYLEGDASFELFKADLRYRSDNQNRWKPFNLTKGVCLDRGKNHEFKLVGFKKPEQTIKWGVEYANKDLDPLWIGDTQYINDSNVYMSATPAHISDSGYVIFNLSTKSYFGNIDILYGYNSENAKPKSSELFNPHNDTIQQSYKCDYPDWYNYTLSPKKHFWCWENYSWEIRSANNMTRIGWDNGSTLIFDHDFDYSIGDTAYWNETQYSEYIDISGVFTKINYNYGGMDTWYYKTGIPITANEMYQIRVWQDVKFNTNGKYYFAAKPSSESISQAIANGHFYSLDPWWNASWGCKMGIVWNITNNMTTAWKIVLQNTSLPPGCSFANNYSDIRVRGVYPNGTEDTVNNLRPYWINYNETNSSWLVMWANLSLYTTRNGTNQSFIYFNNSGALNQSNGDATFTFFDDFVGTSLNSTKWNLTQGTAGGTLNVSNSIVTYLESTFHTKPPYLYGVNTTIEFKMRMPATESSRGHYSGYGNPSPWAPVNSTAFYPANVNTNNTINQNNGAITSVATTYKMLDYAHYQIKRMGNTNVTYWVENNYVKNITTKIPLNNMSPYFQTDNLLVNNKVNLDYVFVRNYILNEPTFNVGGYEIVSTADTTPPTFSTNSTNSTVAGTTIKHSLLAADETALSGYIFSFDNGTGTFINDTWAAFGATGWANVSKGVNTTVGSTIRWFVWANDTSNNKNQSQIYSYLTTAAPSDSCTCPSINTNWQINMSDNCILYTNCDLGSGNLTWINTGTFTINATLNIKNISALSNGQIIYIKQFGILNGTFR